MGAIPNPASHLAPKFQSPAIERPTLSSPDAAAVNTSLVLLIDEADVVEQKVLGLFKGSELLTDALEFIPSIRHQSRSKVFSLVTDHLLGLSTILDDQMVHWNEIYHKWCSSNCVLVEALATQLHLHPTELCVHCGALITNPTLAKHETHPHLYSCSAFIAMSSQFLKTAETMANQLLEWYRRDVDFHKADLRKRGLIPGKPPKDSTSTPTPPTGDPPTALVAEEEDATPMAPPPSPPKQQSSRADEPPKSQTPRHKSDRNSPVMQKTTPSTSATAVAENEDAPLSRLSPRPKSQTSPRKAPPAREPSTESDQPPPPPGLPPAHRSCTQSPLERTDGSPIVGKSRRRSPSKDLPPDPY